MMDSMENPRVKLIKAAGPYDNRSVFPDPKMRIKHFPNDFPEPDASEHRAPLADDEQEI
jgi:hypothetical protein